ncbi:hypothetical protein NDU88_009829 [Pleurodeles waltl]|uniref:Uncharacterized protein n=1 Tax=Pleurodeles waltl TaxID=8319 RepID=A0AAV7QSP6_PLEWA|nr:hypothetical protein NDU88_009829 [Pleurodeles waltl]
MPLTESSGLRALLGPAPLKTPRSRGETRRQQRRSGGGCRAPHGRGKSRAPKKEGKRFKRLADSNAVGRTSRSWHLNTSLWLLRNVTKQKVADALTTIGGAIVRVGSLFLVFKVNMAPKAFRNPGDKNEGTKTTRIGRDKGEPAQVNKRLTSLAGKTVGGKNMPGLGKDVKTSDSITPSLEIKGKGKSQSTIMTFFAGGALDSVSVTPSSENKDKLGEEFTLPNITSKELCIENNESSVKPIQNIDIMSEIKGRESREKEFGPPMRNNHPQTQQFDQSEHPEPRNREGNVILTGPIMERVDQHEAHGSPKRWGKNTGKDSQLMDWGKDSSDKFYSLTEESDPSSIGYSLSESEDSEISATGNISSSNEPTVRQPRRQRKSVKIRPCSQEGSENSMSMGGKTLKWDYSGVGLADTPTLSHQGSTNGKMERETGARPNNSSTMGTEAGMLQSIYSSIKELQTETRIESRRARIATKRLQGSVRKVVKSCTEIEAKLGSMEERIVAVEEEVDTLKEQSAVRNEQLTDVMWKMEDFENRRRRNNLRFLGIPEGLEGKFLHKP